MIKHFPLAQIPFSCQWWKHCAGFNEFSALSLSDWSFLPGEVVTVWIETMLLSIPILVIVWFDLSQIILKTLRKSRNFWRILRRFPANLHGKELETPIQENKKILTVFFFWSCFLKVVGWKFLKFPSAGDIYMGNDSHFQCKITRNFNYFPKRKLLKTFNTFVLMDHSFTFAPNRASNLQSSLGKRFQNLQAIIMTFFARSWHNNY